MADADQSIAFFRDLIHELKDPFAPIYGGLELLGEPSLSELDREQLRGSMVRNSQALKRVLEDASSYLRLLGGTVSAPPEPHLLSGLLDTAANQASPQITTRGQTVTLVSPDGLGLLVDGAALAGCLAGLLGALSRDCSYGDKLCLQASVAKQCLLVEVFSPNGQRPARDYDYRFLLASRLADSLGGQLKPWSSGESGFGWVLTMPFHSVASPTRQPPNGVKPTTPAQRVLVIDDNRDGADTLAMWLEAKGFEVAVAYDGATGLVEFDRFCPHIGLFDIGLPGMNGYELANEVRNTGFTGCLVAITGYGQDKDRSAAAQSGFDHHLVKPVNLGALDALLDTLRPAPPRSRMVLVVEDNPVARQVSVMMLRKLGHEATSAHSAEEGLAEIFTRLPDLVLCDLGLPGKMDGCDLAKELRRHAATRHLPLLAVTGDSAASRQRALEAGFDQVLEKPLDEDTLRRVVEFPRP